MLDSTALVSVLAQAAPAAAAEGNTLMTMLPLVLMFVVLYFLMIRPQMKRQKEHRNLISSLAKGDEVVTAGGVLGKVTKVTDTYLTVDISAEGNPIEIVVQKSGVTNVLPKGTIKAL